MKRALSTIAIASVSNCWPPTVHLAFFRILAVGNAALSVSYFIVMLTMPSIGAYADLRAAKKRILMIVTAGCVAGTALLALATPGAVVLAMLLIIVSSTFYNYGESLTAAFLPELARTESLGKVSGWGWSFGYFGG
ncbi:MAG: MFS transporter, partial [Hyphomicrobiales bacterium]